MKKDKKQKVVVIDKHHDSLGHVLGEAGFDIVYVKNEKEIEQATHNHSPSLIIGDFKTEDINVPRFCKKMKRDYLLRHTPIIIVTQGGEIKEKIDAVNGGADDYIVSPFLDDELLARVNRVIHANENALNANPLTKLPGNISLKQEITERIIKECDFAAYYVDLDNFKVFNDCYGYERGDLAINLTAQILIETLNKNDFKRDEDFIGHIGGDDFVLLTCPKKVDLISKEIIREFDKRIIELYDKKDSKKKYIIGRDRKGRTNIYSMMTLSIAVAVSQGNKRYKHLAEISQLGAEIKKYLKQYKKSIYLVDRRN
ncbi:MAG: diguanylate cyclase [Candidatus Aureabacteria bacterium]|nr:diguanylate cyclase [Candidatus Auribacterota bacterium]